MSPFDKTFDRRTVLGGSAAALGVAALSSMPFGNAFAAGFPDGDISVTVPTRAGGGADRNLRAFTSIWKKYLDTTFKPDFKPGASGRVGCAVVAVNARHGALFRSVSGGWRFRGHWTIPVSPR